MSDYTYAFENRTQNLERYEWDNVWWEKTDVTSRPRVIYIGDSISCATRRVATNVAKNTILFDGLGTSKAVDNPYFCETVSLFAHQQKTRSAVLFNNGLHGWHLEDETEYRYHYENLIKFLLQRFEGTPIFLLLTTAVADPERDGRVQIRNRAVSELAQQYGLPIIDLYSIIKARPELFSSDGVHLLDQGYYLLAEELVDNVKQILNL